MAKNNKNKLENLYSGLEWYFVGSEMKDYLSTTAFMGTTYEWRNKRCNMFDSFIGFATGNDNVNYLTNSQNNTMEIIQNDPDYTIELIFNNLRNYILSGKVDAKEMGISVLEFLDYYAAKKNVINPYDEASILEIEESKMKASRQEAWDLMINSSKIQRNLKEGSTVSEEIDNILDKYNIKIVVPKYVRARDVKDFSQVTFLKRKEENPNEYLEIDKEEKSKLKKDMISLHIAATSLKLSFSIVKLANDSHLSLVTTNPYLLTTVKNMEEEAENVKKLCFHK